MPLLFPVRDNLPEEESELSPVWVRHVERTLAQILQRLDQLESVYMGTFDRNMLTNLKKHFKDD